MGTPRRVIVTGAAGFIGFHVAGRLAADGASVLGLDNLNAYYDPRLKQGRLAELARSPSFRFEKLDIATPGALAEAFAAFRPDAVVHLAAQAGVRHSIDHPDLYAQANLVGFLNVLEACRRHPVRHLIYASSSSVYGRNAKVPFSEHDGADHPVSLYAATKRANELMASTYAHLYAIPATGLRFFTVYGPWGRPDMAYFKFTSAILAGQPIEVFNGGRMERDFTYVADVVEAIARLVERPPVADPGWDARTADPATSAAPHRIYNIGNHTPVTLERFIAAIEAACGRPARRVDLPMQAGDVERTYADVAALTAAVGFSPATSIEDGIARFVTWYRGWAGVHRGRLQRKLGPRILR